MSESSKKPKVADKVTVKDLCTGRIFEVRAVRGNVGCYDLFCGTEHRRESAGELRNNRRYEAVQEPASRDVVQAEE